MTYYPISLKEIKEKVAKKKVAKKKVAKRTTEQLLDFYDLQNLKEITNEIWRDAYPG